MLTWDYLNVLFYSFELFSLFLPRRVFRSLAGDWFSADQSRLKKNNEGHRRETNSAVKLPSLFQYLPNLIDHFLDMEPFLFFLESFQSIKPESNVSLVQHWKVSLPSRGAFETRKQNFGNKKKQQKQNKHSLGIDPSCPRARLPSDRKGTISTGMGNRSEDKK